MTRAARGVLLLALVTSTARGDDAALEKQVDALVAELDQPDAAARAKAQKQLVALGAPALPLLVARVPPAGEVGSPRWDGVLDALAAIDREGAIAEIECTRSEWKSRGWLEDEPPRPKGGSPLRAVDRMLARLRSERAAALRRTVTLVPSQLAGASAIPPWLEEPIDGKTLPEDMAGDAYPVRERDGVLEIDATKSGRFVRVPADAQKVIELGQRKPLRKVIVYRRAGRWLMAPAATWTAEISGVSAEILDADFNGLPDDVVRFDAGAFRHPARLRGWSRDGVFTWTGSASSHGARPPFTVEWQLEPQPAWRTPMQARMLDALNSWRQQAGLAPQSIDRARSEACRLHHVWWAENGFTWHDEEKSAAGSTAEGRAAGKASSVSENPDGAEFVRRIGWTVLHRGSCVAHEKEGAGAFAGGSGSLLWGGDADVSDRGFPILVPGPGTQDVPVLCEPEVPAPDKLPQFYAKHRGAPVSVTWSGMGGAYDELGKIRLELFADDTGAPLPGTLFSREYRARSELKSGFPEESAVFVADEPLRGGTRYVARFHGVGRGGAVDFAWEFRTAD